MNSPESGHAHPASVLNAFQEVMPERLAKLGQSLDRLSLQVMRQLEAFTQRHCLLGPIAAPLQGWAIPADLALLRARLIQGKPTDLVDLRLVDLEQRDEQAARDGPGKSW